MSYAKVRAILDAATPGRWAPPDDLDTFADGDKCDIEAVDVEGDDGYPVVVADYLDPDNARAIVLTRNLASELLAVAEAAADAVAQAEHSTTGRLWHYEVEALRAALDALHAKMKETV